MLFFNLTFRVLFFILVGSVLSVIAKHRPCFVFHHLTKLLSICTIYGVVFKDILIVPSFFIVPFKHVSIYVLLCGFSEISWINLL